MIYKNTDLAKWGVGKGAPLSSLEADTNVWDLVQRIDALQENPVLPAEISGFAVEGRRLTVTMSDGRSFGPFALPIAAFRWRADWAPATTYVDLDVVRVADVGVYLVLQSHASAATFDPNAMGEDAGALYHQVFGAAGTGAPAAPMDDAYDIGFFLPGAIPATGAIVFSYLATRPLYMLAWLQGSQLRLAEPATTETIVFSVRKNGVEIGTFQFAPGVFDGTQAVIMSWPGDADIPLAIGDQLTIVSPWIADATAAGLSMTIKAHKDLEPAA